MKNKQKKTVLVAGGAGFVGSHLCDYLIAHGNSVVALDNLSTGSNKNIKHLLRHRSFKFIQADVTHKSACYMTGVNEIYHLASPASPPRYQKDPIATWKANTLGTLNLLELARRYKAKLLFASTSEIYGNPLVHPQTENYHGNVNPIGIRACYDESKRAGEALCMDYNRVYRLNVKIVRIFNTYGPRMDRNDGRVVSNFITQALRHSPLTVYGKGSQTRSFQYVDDLISGIIKMMSSKITGPVNLGNPKEFTILELAKKIINLTNSSSGLVYRPLPEDDPKQRRPDIDSAKKWLDWEPEVRLKEGLLATVDYFRNE